MTLDDIPAVLEIEQSNPIDPWGKNAFVEELNHSFSSVYVAHILDEKEDERWKAEDEKAQKFNASRLAPCALRLVGYVCFWKVVDEIQIFNIAVHKTYRRRGIGKTLLLYALKQGCASGGRIAVLEVRKGNLAARHLYESVGFRPVGQRSHYYSGPDGEAVLMELEMDGDWRLKWLSSLSPDVLYREE